MKKVLITFGLMLFLTNFAYSDESKCGDFKKFSKEYLKCNADKIKNVTIKKVLNRGLGLFFGLAIKKSVGNLVENVCKAKIDFMKVFLITMYHSTVQSTE